MKKTLLIIGLIAILSLFLVQSLQFSTPVEINNDVSAARSSDDLFCRWTNTPDTAAIQVFWYADGVLNTTKIVPNGTILDIMTDDNTSVEQIWNCTVQLYNGSEYLNQSDTIYIEYDPRVFVNGTEVNSSYTLYEDLNYTVIWNTTRAHSSYNFEGLTPGLCDSPTLGTTICRPRSVHLGNNQNTSNSTFENFLYWYSGSAQGHVINFTIINVNDAPTFNVTNISIAEDESWNGSSATILIADEEDNFPVIFDINLTTAISFCTYNTSGRGITFDCDPDFSSINNHTIYMTVTDNGTSPRNTTKEFILEITDLNNIPIITDISTTNASQGNVLTITLNASDIGENNKIYFNISGNCNISNPWTGITNSTSYEISGPNISSYGYSTWSNTLTNDHIICRNITITVSDNRTGSNTTNLFLNLSNVNDAPEIHNFSTALDQLNNTLLYNLTAYELAPFNYKINATDPDKLITFNSDLDPLSAESIIYTTNETTDPWIRNNLDNTTGIITVPSSEMNRSGNYSFLITVTDTWNQTVNATMHINVLENNKPYFNQTLNISCAERDSLNYPYSCFANLSLFAKDDDVGDGVSDYEDNSDMFNITSNGIIEFNATQSQVGEHEINITITDQRGATNFSTLYLYINNTNNKPALGSINVPAPPNSLLFNTSKNNVISIPATDLDTNLNGTNISLRNYNYESLTFNVTSNNLSIVPYLIINSTTRTLTINTSLEIGTYNATIIVRDNYFNFTGKNTSDNDNTTITFTIYNTTSPPIINRTGYGINGSTINWTNTRDPDVIQLSFGSLENITYSFRQETWDENPENLTYKWYYDNVQITNTSLLNTSNNSIEYYLGFFEAENLESEIHTLELTVIDGYDNTLNDSFTWTINVTDLNRPLYLKNPIPNITINGSRNIENKDLWNCINTYGFYDPDYDYDSDGIISCGESNFSITYTMNEATPLCDGYASIDVSSPYDEPYIDLENNSWIEGHGIVATALVNGTNACHVNFTATDGEYTSTSNEIYFTTEVVIPVVPNEVEVSNRRGTRTITETEIVQIPIPEEIETPVPIDIVMADMVTVYEDETINIPLTITNTWNETIYGVELGFKTNDSLNYSVRFERKNFFKIDPGQMMKTNMIVSGYRVGGIYEILVTANVTEPPYLDSAKIYLNSIEQSSTGTEVRTLIRFAQDLLSKNKECQELEEVLNRARTSQQTGDLNRALDYVNSVINGCKYLISEKQKESPTRLRNFNIPIKQEYLIYFITGILGLGIIVGGSKAFQKSKKK
jgi:hypothetical protein